MWSFYTTLFPYKQVVISTQGRGTKKKKLQPSTAYIPAHFIPQSVFKQPSRCLFHLIQQPHFSPYTAALSTLISTAPFHPHFHFVRQPYFTKRIVVVLPYFLSSSSIIMPRESSTIYNGLPKKHLQNSCIFRMSSKKDCGFRNHPRSCSILGVPDPSSLNCFCKYPCS